MSRESQHPPRLQHQMRTVVALATMHSDNVGRRIGLLPTEVQILNLLKLRDTAMSVADLRAISRLPASSLSRAIDRLVANGYVRRWQDEADRRRVLIEADPVSEAKLSPEFVAIASALQRAVDQFDDDELEVIERFLDELRSQLEGSDW